MRPVGRAGGRRGESIADNRTDFNKSRLAATRRGAESPRRPFRAPLRIAANHQRARWKLFRQHRHRDPSLTPVHRGLVIGEEYVEVIAFDRVPRSMTGTGLPSA